MYKDHHSLITNNHFQEEEEQEGEETVRGETIWAEWWDTNWDFSPPSYKAH